MAVVNIPDRNASLSNRLAVCWGVGNQLAVSQAINVGDKRQPVKVGNLQGPSAVHDIRFETSQFDPIYRKLANESVSVFLNLQKMQQDAGQDGVAKEQLVHISRQYRSILRACQEQLDTMAESASEPAQADKYQEQGDLLCKHELIWHLVEIQYIDTKLGGIVLGQLLHWISLHFTECEEKARQILNQAGDCPETHADFWPTLTDFILQGRLDQASNLLRLHSEFASDPFTSLHKLMSKMPLCTVALSGHSSIADFEYKWRTWQREVISRLQDKDFAAFPQLTAIAEILAGKEEAFSLVEQRCETWYQWLVSHLLYTNPAVKSYELATHAQQAIDRFGGLNTMTSLDSILLSIFEYDISQMMTELCLTSDNFWFPSHLLDLLYHSEHVRGSSVGGLSETSDNLVSGEMRESLLLDHATALMSHNSLWQLGAIYLDHCPVQGKERLEAMLERVSLTSDYKAAKVIQMASERGLSSVVTSTCKVVGMKALARSDTGSAMAWALKSQDAKFATFLSDKLLEEYSNSGSFSSTDLLDNLGSSIVVSDRLTFLGKYREFHRLKEEDDLSGAASLLHSLLSSRLAPKYFWVTLLLDSAQFLDTTTTTFFSSNQIYELLQCLQELSTDTSLPKKQQVLLEEQELQIRRSIARNLAQALIKEGDSGSTLVNG